MPRNLATFAHCAAPGVAKSHKNFDGLLGVLVSSWFSNKAATIIGALAIIIPIVIMVPCFGVIPIIATIVAMLQEAKDWYYNQRLLCIDEKENCVVGSVLHQPEVSFDGDRKMDLLLAPYSEAECYRTIATHLKANKGLLNNANSFVNPPFFQGQVPEAPPDCDPDILTDPNATADERKAERKKIAEYLEVIHGEDAQDGDASSNIYNNFLIGYMDRLLDSDNKFENGESKNFQGKYYRKDPNVIAPNSALSAAIPHDYDANVNWQATDSSISPLTENNPYEVQHQPRGLNPMFRFDSTRLLPYLHCEIDGNYIAILLDQLSLTLVSFGIAYTFVCMILGPLLGLLLGALFAFLVWLLQWLLDGGSDAGEASEPEVDYDDPDNFGEDGEQLDGDLVSIYGPWIMDTEHAQYFEIHPVKAYYIIGRNGSNNEIGLFDSKEEQEKSKAERLHNGLVDSKLKDAICKLVNEAEKGTLPGQIDRDGPTVLSHGLTTFYGGGGVQIN